MAFNYTPLNTIFSWFQTGDFPTQEQFQNSWSSFWHKGEQIPLGMIENLDVFMQSTASAEALENHINSSAAHYDYLAAKDASNLDENNTTSWRNKLGIQDVPENIALVDFGENQSVFNKEQITSLCLLLSEYVNNDGKILADKIEALGLTELITVNENTLPAFIANYQSYSFEKNDIIAIPDVNGNFSLYIFKGSDKTNLTNYLPTGLSNITISMVQGLQDALDSKMNKPNSVGDYYIAKTVVGGVSYYQYKTISLTDGQIPRSYGTYIGASSIFEDSGNKIGIGTVTPTEKLDVNGNVKANAYKFNLQSSITPTPNTFIPKIDGSRPIWYNNGSVGKDMALLEDINSTNITNAINSATSAQKTTMRTALLGAATPASPTISGANPSIISKGVDTYIDLYGLNLTLLDPSFIYIKRADDTHINALQFYNLTSTSVRTLWNLPSDLPDGVYQIYIQNGVTVQGASKGYLYVTNQQLTQVNILQNQWIKKLNPQADGSPAVQNGNGNTYNIALDNYVRLHNSSHNGVSGRSTWKSPNILPTGFNDVWSVSASMLYSGAGAGGGTIIPFIGVTKTTDAEFLVPSDINILENTFTQLWAEGMRYGFTGGNLVYSSTVIPLQIVIEKPVGDKVYLKIIYDTGTTITTVYQNAVPITLDTPYAIFMNLQPSTYGNMWWSAQFTVKKLINS